MLALSILCSLCFTFPYGLWRTVEYFRLGWASLASWHRTTLGLAIAVVPPGLVAWRLSWNIPVAGQVGIEVLLGLWCAVAFLRLGLEKSLRAEACRLTPAPARPLMLRLTGIHPAP